MDAALFQITERVRAALADHTPLRLRGGGSKDFHALQLQGDLLDTRDWRGIVSYEPSELVVTVRAGTPLAELEAVLAAQGQCLAFEPPHFGAATVGGMVATGWSGPSRASVGAVRDYVLGVEILNGRAELLRFGGQVMKNVAGYDVSRLMAGSWGTLGLITEVSLKVLPVAPGETTLRFDGLSQAEALQRLNQWGGQPLPLNASCWVPDAAGADTGTLYLRLRGARAAVEAACRSLGGVRLDDAATAADWQACREQTLPWFAQRAADHVLWRLSVPQTAPELALPHGVGAPLIEWQGGLRWVQAPRSQGPALQALAQSVGGSASLFRAESADQISASPIFDVQNPAVQRIQAQLRQAFDPVGIFNPGRTMA
ncbi:glycolate oxidase subunit GlcE [Comamonas aquatica]|uniref:glycolate oxidase subunit GlcE n=1 Tax=Comamonas aquatica TaxID=225991 RepID=UPI00244D4001|nr:glycolate oxidase subunit GlcE [Comamonas aquatica]MDH0382551.1 glycolate oxidase subunit GlcE [Comamonas aquatica]MDH0430639.1 glycolate oxidase subunit GlcE [Comamonas aquatica]MDH0941509.1 glycolate oxidase subunit GlcE [Comamonas aquatica]